MSDEITDDDLQELVAKRLAYSVERYEVLEAMRVYGGGFAQSLAQAWERADVNNEAKLGRAFPELYEEYRKLAALNKARKVQP